MYNIVTNTRVINEIKKCSYFKTNLGLVSTIIPRSGNREFNTSDAFAYYYITTFGRIIYAQGNIGNIKFYTDYYINNPVIYYFIGENVFEQFTFNVDFKYIKENGINKYLNDILKESESEYEKRKENEILKKCDKKHNGDANKIMNTPGMVTWDDVLAYKKMEKKKNIDLL